MASIKVFDPVSVPLCVLEELQQLRAQVEQLRQENERLRQENERLRRELDEARAGLDQAQRQSKRQAAPFSKGPPKPQPKTPGRKSGQAHGRHGHRSPPSLTAVDEILEAPLPDSFSTVCSSISRSGIALTHQLGGVAPGAAGCSAGSAKACCTVGGRATPVAWNTFPHVPCTSLRSRNRFPSWSTSTNCNRSRSPITSAHSDS